MTLAEQRLDPFCCSWPLVCFQVTVISTFCPEMEPASRRRRCSSTSGSRSCRIHPITRLQRESQKLLDMHHAKRFQASERTVEKLFWSVNCSVVQRGELLSFLVFDVFLLQECATVLSFDTTVFRFFPSKSRWLLQKLLLVLVLDADRKTKVRPLTHRPLIFAFDSNCGWSGIQVLRLTMCI